MLSTVPSNRIIRGRARGNRDGYVMAFYVLLLFGLLGLAALVIDLGFARVTQRQMQTAVETAAVEGLRYRDEFPIGLLEDPVLSARITSGCGAAAPDDPAWRDCARRVIASHRASQVFDDDLLAGSDDAWQFGAGPRLNFSGGLTIPTAAGTEIRASSLMSVGDPPVYDPELRFNTGNAQDGDVVAGQFGENMAFPFDPTSVAIEEGSTYNRRDFVPAAAVDAVDSSALLVRMRRSNESFDAGDSARSGDVSLPFIFARGGSILNPEDGITVRATGIAATDVVGMNGSIQEVGRAKSVGSPQDDDLIAAGHNLPGAVPFVLTRSDWESLVLLPTQSLTVISDGRVLLGGVDSGSFAISSNGLPDPSVAALGVGMLPVSVSSVQTSEFIENLRIAAAENTSGQSFGYVAIVADPADTNSPEFGRIIGFGRLNNLTPGVTADVLTAIPATSGLAGENVSNVFLRDGVVTDVLVDEHRSFSEPVLTPVLVN